MRRFKRISRLLAGLTVVGLLSPGCAVLHHAQVGEIDSKVVLTGEYFEIKMSEVGYDVGEIVEVAEALTRSKGDEDEGSIADIIELFQMGPKTGNPVFDDAYADPLFDRILRTCPSGRVSGLMSIRETADYGMISGEIVKLTGYCAKRERSR